MPTIAELLSAAIQRGESNQAGGRNKGHRGSASPVPVMGLGGANIVRLSPQVREILRRRARRQAGVGFAPEIQALKRQKAQLAETRDEAIASAEGYTDLAADTVAGTSLQGLHGQYRQQVADELANRSADIRASAPALAQEATDQYQADKSALQMDILNARIEKKKAIAGAYNSLFNSAITDAQSRATEERKQAEAIPGNVATGVADVLTSMGEDKAADRKTAREGRHNFLVAMREAERLLSMNPANLDALQKDEEGAWESFEEVLNSQPDTETNAVYKVLDYLYPRVTAGTPKAGSQLYSPGG